MGDVEHLSAGRPRYAPPRPIRPDDRFEAFDSGKPPLDDYLRQRALKSEGRHARTYVIISAGEVAAYYTLNAGAVQLPDAPGALRRNAPNPLPVLVLGRMAVDVRHRGRGLGKAMLQEAMRRSLAAAEMIGAAALIVHAIDDEAVTFYTQYGFQTFPTGTRTLFLPMKTIAQALG